MRKKAEILAAENEFFEKVWFGRSSMFIENDAGEMILAPRYEVARAAFEKILAKYGEEALVPKDDFEWGMLSGKLSALRWVLGDEWDFLDT